MKKELLKYKILFTSILLVFTIILVFLFFYTLQQDFVAVEKLALEQAKTSFNKDLVYHRWSSQNGGVYVLLQDSFKPNPYLKVKEREITSSHGKTYTLINPAYMTRMVLELAKEQYKVKGHITSLKPINPANQPDEWEKRVLTEFEKGGEEYYSKEIINGENYLRYMRAMVTEKSCLKCHSEQGYKVGDIRGGISVSVPLAEYEVIYQTDLNHHIFAFLGIYLGVGLILFTAYWILSNEFKKRLDLQTIQLENASRHKWILKSAINGVIITDYQGNILDSNPAYSEMSGYTEEELRKLKISDLKYVENKEDVKNHIERMHKYGKDRFETIHRRKDGTIFNVDASKMLEPLKGEEMVSFFEDITERKNAEIELFENEKKFRQLFENMNEAFALHKIIMDSNNEVIDYYFIDINPKFEELTGLKKENIIGESVLEVMPDTEKYWIERYGNVALTGEPIEFSNYAKELDKYYHVKVYSPEKNYFAVTFSDVTSSQKAEKKLIESEKRFRKIIEHAPDAVYVHDFNGKIVATNQKACDDTGYTREEILSMSVIDIEGSYLKTEDIQEMWSSIEESKSVSIDGIHKRKDGRTFSAEIHISKIYIQEQDHYVAFVHDLTPRINAKKALQESEEKYRNLVETAQELIWKCDINGRFTYLNKAWENTHGYKVEEMLGKNFGEFQYEEIFQRDVVEFTRHMEGGLVKGYETTHLAKDGTELTLLFNAIPVINEDGNIIGTQGTASDITGRKKYEDELEKHQNHLEQLVKERTDELEASNLELRSTNEELYKQRDELELAIKKLNEAQLQLIQSEKMASLGVLVAGVAHEINNPVNFINSSLTGLKNNLNYLLSFTDLYSQLSVDNIAVIEEINERQKEANLSDVLEMFKRSVEIMEVGIDRTTKIVKSLKSFVRSDEKELVRYNIHQNIDNTLLILYHQYKNHIEIKKEYGEIPLIVCYAGQINQVLMNILTNAIQAISEKGTITISSRKIDNESIALLIEDNGIGISKDDLAHIFDPFFTTKKVGKGTGLGLSISYNIIKDHNGKILVTSEKGKGSGFRIILPINQG